MLKSHLLGALMTCAALAVLPGTANAQHRHGGHNHHGGHHHHGGHNHYHGHYHNHGYLGFYGYSSPYFYGYPSGYSTYSYPAYPAFTNPGSYYGLPATTWQNPGTITNQPANSPTKGTIQVLLPTADAQVLVDGNQTTSLGMTRFFESPDLEPGKTFTYTIQASWNKGTQPVTEVRTVQVSAGRVSAADFTRPPEPERLPAPGKGLRQ